MKLIRIMTLASFLMLLVGCSRTSVYVLNQSEIQRVQEGQAITAKFKGWLLSDRAVDRVTNAKIKAVNLE